VGNSNKLDQLQRLSIDLLGTNHNLKKKQNIKAGLMQY
jgi:hypothetical protein